jgi:hypothetical protein
VNTVLIILVVVAGLLALLALLGVPAKFDLTAAAALLLAIALGLELAHVT